MDESERVLHHSVSGGEFSKGKRRDRGITWPARHLAREIGPRGPGSRGERSAALFCEREMKSLDLDVETQEFHTPPTTAWSEMIVHIIPVLGTVVFPANSHLSFVLVCLGYILFLFQSYGRSPFAWMQPYRRSGNVIVRMRPSREKRRTLVVLAHVDSPRAAFYHHSGFIWMLRGACIVDLICMTALFMLFTTAYAGHLLSMEENLLNLLWYLGQVIAAVPTLCFIALFSKAIGAPTPGGNDNASGVAVLVELARAFARRQPLFTELWLVFTGAADAGGTGVKRLLRRNRRELKGAYFIVLDAVGRGFPVCFRREGRLVPFRANRRLMGLAKQVFETRVHYGAGFRRNGLYLGEGFHLLSRGRKAITVSSREESPYPRHWRCSKDGYDNLDLRSLRLSLDFMVAYVDSIDRIGLKP